MSEVKQYAERDLMAMDIAGNHYCRHVDHMTREKLHSKSDIAAELGWRDMQIAKLTAERDALAAENVAMTSACWLLAEECAQTAGEVEITMQSIKTPATDAYLNSVRADAVVNAAAHLGDMAAGKSASTAELIKSCGRALLAFAAQLRAAKDGE